MSIKPKSQWVYVGGSAGHNLVHTVIQVKGANIVTWSNINQGKETEDGYTWSGHKERFLQQFKPASSPPVA